MKEEAEIDVNKEPILNSYYQSSILSHDSLESALANYLANRLSSASLPSSTLFDLFVGILKSDQEIMDSVKDDLKAVKERDPACISHGSKIFRNNFTDGVCKYQVKTLQTTPTFVEEVQENEAVDLWPKMKEEAKLDVNEEPILNSYYQSSILSHDSLESALANYLANRLNSASLPSNTLFDFFVGILKSDQEIMDSVKDDLKAVKERDPACISHVHCFLNFKGFLACQSHRVAHKLWLQGRKVLAFMIQNRVSKVFAVGIHPSAKIGSEILLDHVTGLVVGETTVIGNNVSILHSVTLGGTGKASGDRHPKIGDGILIGAWTCILGNIKVGECAKIGAGSVVIKDVPPRTTVVSDFVMLLF
ncbi:serine acetyltransferase 1, chloroplastic-like [Arachis duranensis]|nr:serine acetyltransferase 1, chloroplastic-like [Arachis duranensis]